MAQEIPLTTERLEAAWETVTGRLDDFLADELEGLDGPEEDSSGGAGLWGGLPAIDSKIVAKASHIFEEELGVSLDPKWIKPGGYDDVDELKAHLREELSKRCTDSEKQTKSAPITSVAARSIK